MLLTELNKVCFSDKRLPSCKHIQIYSKLLALCYDLIHLIKGKVQLVAILCRPAACAVQIAGACRIHKDEPWHIAAILFTIFTDSLGTVNKCLKAQIECDCF